MNAEESYKKNQTEIKKLIKELNKKLKTHEIKFKKLYIRWGFVCDLNYIKQSLKECNEFLN